LVIGKALLKISTPGAVLEILLHFGTLLSILVYYFKDILALITGLFEPGRREYSKKYILALIVATIPAVVIGLSFDDFIGSAFSSVTIVSFNLIFTGFVLFLTRGKTGRDIVNIPLKSALIIGCAQALAILPGISRSGMTIATAIFLGVDNPNAAKFSFLMAVPVLFGAGLLHLKDALLLGASAGSIYTLAGFIVSAITGFICIIALVKVLNKQKIWVFSFYCWTVGTLSLVIHLLS